MTSIELYDKYARAGSCMFVTIVGYSNSSAGSLKASLGASDILALLLGSATKAVPRIVCSLTDFPGISCTRAHSYQVMGRNEAGAKAFIARDAIISH